MEQLMERAGALYRISKELLHKLWICTEQSILDSCQFSQSIHDNYGPAVPRDPGRGQCVESVG